MDIADGAVEILEAPVSGVAFDSGPFDHGGFQIAPQLGLGRGVGVVIVDAHQDGAARLSVQGRTQSGEGHQQNRGAAPIRMEHMGHEWYDNAGARR